MLDTGLKFLCCTIPTYMSDHKVKVTDFEKKTCLFNLFFFIIIF